MLKPHPSAAINPRRPAKRPGVRLVDKPSRPAGHRGLLGQAVGIRLAHVSVTFSAGKVAVTALDNVSLEIGPGEFVAILGPSGCGKSTLLAMLGGLDRPTFGHVYAAGEALDEIGAARLDDYRLRRVATVFQRFHLMPGLTALANVGLPMSLAGVNPPERAPRERHLLDLVGLAHRARFRPDELSGGEQQRLAVARALANRPGLILADEPTGNLDSKSGCIVLDLLKELNDSGATVVVVTHDPSVAARADRIVTMRDGGVVEDPGGRRTLRLQDSLEPVRHMDWRTAVLEGMRSFAARPWGYLITIGSVAAAVAATGAMGTLATGLAAPAAPVRNAFLSLAVITVVVAVLGMINTMSSAVAAHTREIGVMRALGARWRDLLLMYLGQASVIGVVGSSIGFLAAIVANRMLTPTPGRWQLVAEPGLLLSAVVGVLAVTTAAGLLPALRAARQQPASALRDG